MRTDCITYMYKCEWTQDFLRRSAIDYHSEYSPALNTAENVTILPQRDATGQPWGIGGAFYQDGSMVEASQIDGVFGGQYPYNSESVTCYPFTVYYIPIIPRHWGHFLLDVISRFWFVIDGSDQGYPIAFCGKDFPDKKLYGNYLEALTMLGVDEYRLIYIDKPTSFARVIIPEPAFGDGKPYSDQYLQIVDKLKNNVFSSKDVKYLQPYRKIYFTRTQFRRARMTEVGEKEIETLFRENGFSVLAPEKLTFTEQVYYFSTAKEIASISGTISHNIIFCEEGTEVIILNRCSLPNIAQFSVNQMSKAKVTYVDCYAKETMRSCRYWPVWVEVNDNLTRCLRERGYRVEEKTLSSKIKVKIRNYMLYKTLELKLKVKERIGYA